LAFIKEVNTDVSSGAGSSKRHSMVGAPGWDSCQELFTYSTKLGVREFIWLQRANEGGEKFKQV
jgi:hypothetical protein